ncbi:MAG: hypothetical protein AAB223_05865, partial [Pseudomonadota bacterium]
MTIALAALAAGTGWSGAASAQSPKSSEPRIEVQRAQSELTIAERVMRDTRAARAKTETAVAERLARLDERRRNALARPDDDQRRANLRAIAAEQGKARAEQAEARAVEAAAGRNFEAAALALARARSASESSRKSSIEGGGDVLKSPPPGGTAAAPARAAPKPKDPAAAPPPAPAVSLEDLIHVRMDVESAEAALARAKAAREDIERKTGAEVRDLARQLADAVELRKRAGGGPAAR